jgi:hypothetical protein
LGFGLLVLGYWPKPPIPNPQSPIPNPQSPYIINYKILLNLILIKFIYLYKEKLNKKLKQI